MATLFYQSQPVAPPDPHESHEHPTPAPDPRDLEMVGKTAPEWNIPAEYWVNTPRPIKLQDLKGKVTLLEFWRGSCNHCQQAAPFMRDIYQRFKPRGLQVVTFQSPGRSRPGEPNPDNDWNQVRQTVKEWDLTYPVAFDKDGTLFMTKYNARLWPTVILLDRQGKILHLHTGHDAAKGQILEQKIEAELGK